jgi:hypothetical protein
MWITIDTVLNLTIWVPAIVGAIRYKKINSAYYLFIILIWAGIVNENFSIYIINKGYYNIIPYNVYSLIEAFLVICLFKRWKLFNAQKWIFYVILMLFSLVWFIEVIIVTRFREFASYFIIVYSFTIVLCSINQLNKLIVTSEGNLLKNATFLICIGFILYFTYSAFVETFLKFDFYNLPLLRQRIYSIVVYVNAFVNLLYAYAILWIPKKQNFILPSSLPA